MRCFRFSERILDSAQCRETLEVKCHTCEYEYLGDRDQQIFVIRFEKLPCAGRASSRFKEISLIIIKLTFLKSIQFNFETYRTNTFTDYEYRYEITENDGNFSSAANFGPIISENSYCFTKFCESSILHRSSSYEKKGYTLQVSIVIRNGPLELDPVTVVDHKVSWIRG